MVERGEGHLVFISSVNGLTAPLGTALYSATKFGLRGFAAGLRADLHGTGVGVSSDLPGPIRDAGMFAESGAQHPARRDQGAREQVADAVVGAIEKNAPEIDVAPAFMRFGWASSACRRSRGRGFSRRQPAAAGRAGGRRHREPARREQALG